jgi:hypothetical protein
MIIGLRVWNTLRTHAAFCVALHLPNKRMRAGTKYDMTLIIYNVWSNHSHHEFDFYTQTQLLHKIHLHTYEYFDWFCRYHLLIMYFVSCNHVMFITMIQILHSCIFVALFNCFNRWYFVFKMTISRTCNGYYFTLAAILGHDHSSDI